MGLARVVSFENVSAERIEQLKREIGAGPPPDGLPATEILLLHDADAQRAVVVLFFATEEAYAQGDATLNAMPAEDIPGRRATVQRFSVALRRTV